MRPFGDSDPEVIQLLVTSLKSSYPKSFNS